MSQHWLRDKWRRFGFAFRLAFCFFIVTSAGLFVSLMDRSTSGASLLWVENGVLLAYFLLAPRWLWPKYIFIGLAAFLTSTLIAERPFDFFKLAMIGQNMVEVLTAAFLLRRRSTVLPRFADGAYLLRFFSFGVIVAPAVASLLLAAGASWELHLNPVVMFFRGVLVDGMGILVATPACVAVFRTRFRDTVNLRSNWVYPILLIGVATFVFFFNSAPVAFLCYPVLILILLRMGLGWAAFGTLFLAIVGSWSTLGGSGPFANIRLFGPGEPSILMGIYLAGAMCILYSVSTVLESQKRTERRLQQIVALHELVTHNSRDLIILADLDCVTSFVSDAATTMGGWDRGDLIGKSCLDVVHADDFQKMTDVIQGLRKGSDGATVEIRMRRKNGSYMWVEESLRTVRRPESGVPTGILKVVRDISERKVTEKKLQDAYKTVEALAVTDALTGLANRRRFDQVLATEWRRSIRDRSTISMLMIDVDFFKSFNDAFGHPKGDSCLKQIAEACLDVIARSGDLVARFGGEEFAVILPHTTNEGALELAHEICDAIRGRELPHPDNPNGMVTVSVGCATLTPSQGKHGPHLVELADLALYQAKRSGRNRVCNAPLLDIEPPPAPPLPAPPQTSL